MNREDNDNSTIPNKPRIKSLHGFILPLLRLFLLVAVSPLSQTREVHSWCVAPPSTLPTSVTSTLISKLHRHSGKSFPNKRRLSIYVFFMVKADPFRDSNKIRPSLHPITINILAQVLKLRASSILSKSLSVDNRNNTLGSTPSMKDENIWSDQPLDVVMTVSTIASKALQQRQQTSSVDQMTFTIEEQQTIAGRVVGVMVRLESLQNILYNKCSNVEYVQKYNEWSTFGLLERRSRGSNNNNSSSSSSSSSSETVSVPKLEMEVEEQQILYNDPLLLLNRAECLLALFMHTVEIPELQSKNCTVPDQSRIDFLDTDRQQVLLN